LGILSKLAWRNIWRNKRRTILTFSAISLATGILVFFMALQFSMYDASIRASTSAFQGHMQVQLKGYLDKPQMRSSFARADQIREEIKKIDGIRFVSERGQAFALVSSEDRTYGVQIVGVEPEEEKNVSSIPGLVRQGQYLSGLEGYEVVIGSALANNLKVKLGDEITVLGQGKDGSLAATALKVKGLFESGVQELDRSLIEMPLQSFKDVFSMGDEIHALVIVTDKLEKIGLLQKQVDVLLQKEQKSNQLVALTWEEILPGIKQAIQFDMTFGWMFYFSLILVVVFSVLNTFLMSILERTREFGLMLALGMRPISVARLVLRECVILTSIGIFVGLIIGSSIIFYYHTYGFYMPGSEEMMKLWNIQGVAKPDFSIAALTIGPLVILATTFLALLYPLWRIIGFEAVEAMRAT